MSILTLYTDEFQMLLQKIFIVLYLTELVIQNAKEKMTFKYFIVYRAAMPLCDAEFEFPVT